MILVQQNITGEEFISITPDDPILMSNERLWTRTGIDHDDVYENWHWGIAGCSGVRPSRYIRISRAMFIYDDPFSEYQIPIPASAYQYVGPEQGQPS